MGKLVERRRLITSFPMHWYYWAARPWVGAVIFATTQLGSAGRLFQYVIARAAAAAAVSRWPRQPTTNIRSLQLLILQVFCSINEWKRHTRACWDRRKDRCWPDLASSLAAVGFLFTVHTNEFCWVTPWYWGVPAAVNGMSIMHEFTFD